MIEALLRLLVEIFGLVLVQGLGYVLLRHLRPRRQPSENACMATGAVAWLVIVVGGIAAWHAA